MLAGKDGEVLGCQDQGQDRFDRGDGGVADADRRRAVLADVEIIYLGPYWQAIIREQTGQTIITRHHLKGLLDKLEALDAER